MKTLILIIAALIFFSCSKTEITIINQDPPECVKVLTQHFIGNIEANHGYNILIYEDFGNGNFKPTTSHYYGNKDQRKIFRDTITRPFYFIAVLRNTSLYLEKGKAPISVSIEWDNQHIAFLEADTITFEESYQSPVLN